MRAIRILLGSVLWLLAGVVMVLGALLSVTIILLPVGIPLFLLGKWLMRGALALFLPRAARHPVDEGRKSIKGFAGRLTDRVKDSGMDTSKVQKKAKRSWKKMRKAVA